MDRLKVLARATWISIEWNEKHYSRMKLPKCGSLTHRQFELLDEEAWDHKLKATAKCLWLVEAHEEGMNWLPCTLYIDLSISLLAGAATVRIRCDRSR